MSRATLIQLAAMLVGSSIVLGLFVMRGFNLHDHARIMLTALGVCWLAGCGWTVASAAEDAGGLAPLGGARLLLIVAGSLVAAFAPAYVLSLLGAR